MQELTIKDILRILRKWLLLIIPLPILVAGIAGFYYYRFVPDTYTASSQLYVLLESVNNNANNANYTYDIGSSTQYAADYQQLMRAAPITEAVAKKLGLEDLAGYSVNVTSTTTTRVLNVSVGGRDPEMCANIANTISEVFVEKLEEALKLEPINIWARAETPRFPSGPNRFSSVLTAALAALALCVGFAFAVELLNTSIRTEDDITQVLDLPVLSSVMSYRDEMNKYVMDAGKTSRNLYDNVSGLTKESIKTLSANIQFSSMGKPIKTIMFTSCIPNEGKSSVVCMLAAALAEEGKRVLIVDMDFHSPTIGKLFYTRNRWDLVDYITRRQPLSGVITQAAPNVYFVDTVHKATISTNIVKMPQFDEFIAQVKESFDYVLFDTAPLGFYIDPAILGAKMDASLLVIGAGQSDRKHCQEIVEQLHKANAYIIGAVLNFVSPRQRAYYGYRAYRYNYYGYGSTSHYDVCDKAKAKAAK